MRDELVENLRNVRAVDFVDEHHVLQRRVLVHLFAQFQKWPFDETDGHALAVVGRSRSQAAENPHTHSPERSGCQLPCTEGGRR
jgi:hypothetical protein